MLFFKTTRLVFSYNKFTLTPTHKQIITDFVEKFKLKLNNSKQVVLLVKFYGEYKDEAQEYNLLMENRLAEIEKLLLSLGVDRKCIVFVGCTEAYYNSDFQDDEDGANAIVSLSANTVETSLIVHG